MNKKIVSIFVSMLLCVTVFSVTGDVNVEKTASMMFKTDLDIVEWSDNFDSYALHQYLDGGPDDGGWETWAGAPEAGAYVTNNQSRSPPHSVELVGMADLVHKYSQVNSGKWTYTAWQYIPKDFAGEPHFILCDWYEDGDPTHWAVQLRCSSIDGLISSEFGEENLPLILGEWVEIRVEINFGADEKTVYYGGDELVTSSWTEGMKPGGHKNLGCVNLWNNGATYVYYDDMSLRHQPLSCDAGGPYDGIVDEEIQFDGAVVGGTRPYEYLWEFGNGDTASIEDPVYAYGEPGVYTVNLIVTDADQNIAWDETPATIKGTPILEIGDISGGLFKIKAVIKNIGSADATIEDWNITLDGGFIIMGEKTTGRIMSIPAGENVTVRSNLICGLGRTKIIVMAECDESSDTKKVDAFVFLFIIVML